MACLRGQGPGMESIVPGTATVKCAREPIKQRQNFHSQRNGQIKDCLHQPFLTTSGLLTKSYTKDKVKLLYHTIPHNIKLNVQFFNLQFQMFFIKSMLAYMVGYMNMS